MSADNLDSLTDDQLSEAFAVEVANIPHLFTLMKRGLFYRENANGYTSRISEAWTVTEEVADEHVNPYDEPVTKQRLPYPPFATSADAVLPWLEKQEQVSNVFEDGSWFVGIDREGAHHLFASASAPTFARSACIALIRASRATKGAM